MGKREGARPTRAMMGWLYHEAARQIWRMPTWIDFDDLISEGLLAFAVCSDRYTYVKDAAHFMSLFQRAVLNRYTDIARKRGKLREVPLSDLGDDNSDQPLLERLCGAESGGQMLACLLTEAPKEIRALLRAIATPEGAARLRAPYRRTMSGRETTNERLCSLVGLDPSKVKLSTMIRLHFGMV